MHVEEFLKAVAKRKALDKTRTRANIAVLMQLEDDDIPRLSELVRCYDQAISHILEWADQAELSEDAEAIVKVAAEAHLRVEGIAEAGNLKKWGADEA